MLKLLGKDKQDLGGDLNIAPRVIELYKSTTGGNDTAAVDDVLTTLFPAGVSRWIRVGGAGNLTVLMRDGTQKIIELMLAGEKIEIQCVKIMATGTSATKISVFF